jgi:hypothetical protein
MPTNDGARVEEQNHEECKLILVMRIWIAIKD